MKRIKITNTNTRSIQIDNDLVNPGCSVERDIHDNTYIELISLNGYGLVVELVNQIDNKSVDTIPEVKTDETKVEEVPQEDKSSEVSKINESDKESATVEDSKSSEKNSVEEPIKPKRKRKSTKKVEETEESSKDVSNE